MSRSSSMSPDDAEARMRAVLSSTTETPSAGHDAAVLAAARALAAERRATNVPASAARAPWTPRWLVPASLAAGLALGVLIDRVLEPGAALRTSPALYVPFDATRGGAARSVPVEQADPDHWFRHIQELIAAGERREAEAHLVRFNALHPDYVYQP